MPGTRASPTAAPLGDIHLRFGLVPTALSQHTYNQSIFYTLAEMFGKCCNTEEHGRAAVFQQRCDRLFDMALSHAQHGKQAGLLWFKAYALVKQEGKKRNLLRYQETIRSWEK